MIVDWCKYQFNVIAFTTDHKCFGPKSSGLVTPDISWYAVIYKMRLHKFGGCIGFVISDHFCIWESQKKTIYPNQNVHLFIFFIRNGPAKSNWISSFGSTTASKLVKAFSPDFTLKFLPLVRHSLQFCAAVTISLCRYGYHTFFAASSMLPCPGCVKWIDSSMICLDCLGITALSSYSSTLFRTDNLSRTL